MQVISRVSILHLNGGRYLTAKFNHKGHKGKRHKGHKDFLARPAKPFGRVIIVFFVVKPFSVKTLTFASPKCGCGEIGRRTRLRIWRRKACRFDPCHPHFLNLAG